MQKICFILITFFLTSVISAQELSVSSGTIKRFSNYKSQFVDARTIDVWLPEGFSENEKYAVLYMQDGQMLFDAKSTWNKQAWEIDEVAATLLTQGKIQKFIVVGIWNNGQKRHSEYFPQKPYQTLNSTQQTNISNILLKRGKINSEFIPASDNYLKFVTAELKPFIDSNFPTQKDAKHTFIAGSSMGALISLYAICEYPTVFGGAACLSTHWTGIYQNEDNPIPDTFFSYLKNKLPDSKNHKIYFDYGDQTLDSLYQPSQQKVDAIMKSKGYTSKNWETRFFPGENHSELAWAKRMQFPLLFLL
ncbi:alpha/beta hydrolase [Flavobacterium nackdongense]|uniref:Esterase family protein n=1 Tax=Flavobacterium nackdongense TaxID=2547394 RepID=A0A4P6Y772_9FLAO|nr:alpha/beta hydrolase-fold protein [Flavobacterium nackdongense]QBN18356.1 esterase family protein [Flavobacterium nackdongense]